MLEAHKIDFDIRNVRVRLLIIHENYFLCSRSSRVAERCPWSEGQIEINLLLFPSNHLPLEIVLLDLGSNAAEGTDNKRCFCC